MRVSDRKIKKIISAGISVPVGENSLQKALRESRRAFCENEMEGILSDAEFLFQQSRYIRKRWWLLQAGVLMALWLLLEWTGSGLYIQRYMGVAASLFGTLVLPELWKNRSSNAMEIEDTAYYSLRQVYAARIFLFALVDLMMLGIFFFVAVSGGSIGMTEVLIQFVLPYIVTCCIGFKTLYSSKIDSEVLALFLCIAWSMVWLLILQNEEIYRVVSIPAWLAMLLAAVIYLGYCIWQGQKDCGMWARKIES